MSPVYILLCKGNNKSTKSSKSSKISKQNLAASRILPKMSYTVKYPQKCITLLLENWYVASKKTSECLVKMASII